MDGEWVVALGNPMPNANDAIAEANMFNSPPTPGYQYFMVGVGVKHRHTKQTYSANGNGGGRS